VSTGPFNWELDWMPGDPVPVDAIPDISENQQIVSIVEYIRTHGRTGKSGDILFYITDINKTIRIREL